MKHIALRLSALLLVILAFNLPAKAASTPIWEPVGPAGGDARSFAADPSNPKHLYMGTLDSWLYESQDGGSTWKRLSKLSKSENLVLDNLIVDSSDPKTILVGAWILTRPEGSLFISHDAGATWSKVSDMDGQSIRALSQAPSNAKVFIAGTLKGVYRSDDSGQHWKQISPAGSNELHEVESIAINPVDANTIYAGTWHLPWKTTDGGASWHNIKQGVIDDSDVFSIIIDPKAPTVVYASACSGIYKSENAGEMFRKQQGIPNTARRTRVLMQDPTNSNIVFAGTTEGLYQTANAGQSWQRLTGPDVIVNDVYVDPSNDKHILLATDRGGVLQSQDGGTTFVAANGGFSQRQVETLLVDQKNPSTIYAGVLNDKTYGGVFVSGDGGSSWNQRSNGLEGRDVFTLQQAPNGTVYAGTNHGIAALGDDGWDIRGKVVNTKQEETTVIQKKKKVKVTKTVTLPPVLLDSRVTGLDLSGSTWYAATASGVFTSVDQGGSWQGGPVLGHSDFVRVATTGDWAYAAARSFIAASQDGGKTWQSVSLPENMQTVRFLVTSFDGEVWLGGREGIFYSEDHAQSWKQLKSLPFADVDGLDYNVEYKRLMVTSANGTLMMAIDPVKKDWKWWDIGWNVHTVHSSNGRFVAASLYDGVVLQPKSSEMKLPGRSETEITASLAMIQLRPAGKADLQSVFDLDQVCFPPGIAYSRRNFRELLSSSHTLHVVAEENGSLAGFAFAQAAHARDTVVGLIITIDVASSFRRRGVGRLLMGDIESKLRAADATSIELEVAVDNVAAQAFYTRLGFAVTGRIHAYYAGNLDAYVMEKPLL